MQTFRKGESMIVSSNAVYLSLSQKLEVFGHVFKFLSVINSAMLFDMSKIVDCVVSLSVGKETIITTSGEGLHVSLVR